MRWRFGLLLSLGILLTAGLTNESKLAPQGFNARAAEAAAGVSPLVIPGDHYWRLENDVWTDLGAAPDDGIMTLAATSTA